MYFTDTLQLLWRRWYVVVVGLVLVGVGAVLTLTSVPAQYQASGQMLFLLPPQATGLRTPSNPYINLAPGLTTTAALIATEVMTKDVASELAEKGYTAEYSVALVPSAGPLLTISSVDTDPKKAVTMRNEVMKWLRERLDERQKAVAVPPSQSIYTEDTNVGSAAEQIGSGKVRAVGGVTGAGFMLILLVAFALDRLLSRPRAVPEIKLARVDEQPEPRRHTQGDDDAGPAIKHRRRGNER